jgi:hypothetical protein
MSTIETLTELYRVGNTFTEDQQTEIGKHMDKIDAFIRFHEISMDDANSAYSAALPDEEEGCDNPDCKHCHGGTVLEPDHVERLMRVAELALTSLFVVSVCGDDEEAPVAQWLAGRLAAVVPSDVVFRANKDAREQRTDGSHDQCECAECGEPAVVATMDLNSAEEVVLEFESIAADIEEGMAADIAAGLDAAGLDADE